MVTVCTICDHETPCLHHPGKRHSLPVLPNDVSRYGNRNPVKMYAERNALEKAIRAHDPEATEAAWERVVQWLDLSFASLGVRK